HHNSTRTTLVDNPDRLLGIPDAPLPRTLERQAHGKLEPFGPEVGRKAPDRARDLVLVTGVEGERDEAEARVTDRDVVDIEIELGGERFGFGIGHPHEEREARNSARIRVRSVPKLHTLLQAAGVPPAQSCNPSDGGWTPDALDLLGHRRRQLPLAQRLLDGRGADLAAAGGDAGSA